jgi:hypothetical protein
MTGSVLLLLSTALAAPPEGSDVVSTAVGAQAVHSSAVGQTNLDLMLYERSRLTFVEGDTFRAKLLADTRFTLDLSQGYDTFEWNQVRQLGVRLRNTAYTLDIGRHPVHRGGPRLVDGAQLLLHPSPALDVGLWGGLLPDLFTTTPRLRPGGGPVISYQKPSFQASVVGEVAMAEGGGGIDRLSTLAMARGSLDRLFELSGRADLELLGEDGPHLADLYALSITRPSDAVRFDLLYNAFSTYKYQIGELQDPKVQRFSERIAQLGIDLAITQDALDPTVHHQVGGGVAVQPDTDGGTAPRIAADVRQRFNANELDRFFRAHLQAGLVDLPVGGRLDLLADGNLIAADGETQLNPGLLAIWEPGDEGWFAIDLSARALINPEYDAMGLYTDLFVDAVTPSGVVVNVGTSVISEPDPALDVPDMGLMGYLRLGYVFRP